MVLYFATFQLCPLCVSLGYREGYCSPCAISNDLQMGSLFTVLDISTVLPCHVKPCLLNLHGRR